MSQELNAAQALQHISAAWDNDIVAQLEDYIRIPAKSPMFDADWAQHGHIDRVVRNAASWIEAQNIKGLKLEVVRLAGRTPVLFFEVAASSRSTQTVLLYGHLDKQPEASGWRADLGPWSPKYIEGKLYGRGAADDGYSVYASIAAIAAIQNQQVAHPRIVALIETSEESGSCDLAPYLAALHSRLGDVGLVICLDSGAGNYEQLWLTNSLRGMAGGTLKVQVLNEGVHSGDASGLVPSSFRILRHLLGRLEDSATGRILPSAFHCEIPAERLAQAKATAAILGQELIDEFPWAQDENKQPVRPTSSDPVAALISRTWEPTLSVTGADGLPDLKSAGNVLRPYTAFKLSVRLPPLVDAEQAAAQLKTLLESEAPYGARVSLEDLSSHSGWNAAPSPAWFERALQSASMRYFGAPCGFIGQGGSIGFVGMLLEQFAQAQMMVCGVLGPNSNAHGPNEFLHVPYAKKLTAAVAHVITQMP